MVEAERDRGMREEEKVEITEQLQVVEEGSLKVKFNVGVRRFRLRSSSSVGR